MFLAFYTVGTIVIRSPRLRSVTVKFGKENSADTGVMLKLKGSKDSAAKYVVPSTTAVSEYVSVYGWLAQPTMFVFK